jgi:aspartyl-tRNA(Asn)/glutamyl-tRNA(Gln) amidotransferase subunit A
MVRTQEVSAVEAVESALARVEQVDGLPGSLEPVELSPEEERRVHAFISVSTDRALAQAREVDRKTLQATIPASWPGFRSA